MRACLALLGTVGVAAVVGQPTASPVCRCPVPSDVADVYLGSATPAGTLQAGWTYLIGPWTWIPQDGVTLQPFPHEAKTLHCGHYWGRQCRRTENGTLITVDCKSDVCDVYVFIYHEPPRSSNTNGRLPQTLTPPEWQQGSCAPSFCYNPPAATSPPAGGAQPSERTAKALINLPSAVPTNSPSVTPQPCCRMTAFRRQVDGGSAVSFTVDEIDGLMDAYYMLVAVAPGVRCNSNARSAGREACEAPADCANSLCRWETGSAPTPQLQLKNEHPLERAAHALINKPSANPTASPSEDGRCVDNWCPPGPPGQAPPVCDAPLTEPECPSDTVAPTQAPTPGLQ